MWVPLGYVQPDFQKYPNTFATSVLLKRVVKFFSGWWKKTVLTPENTNWQNVFAGKNWKKIVIAIWKKIIFC